jgi:hypothetical protein
MPAVVEQTYARTVYYPNGNPLQLRSIRPAPTPDGYSTG